MSHSLPKKHAHGSPPPPDRDPLEVVAEVIGWTIVLGLILLAIVRGSLEMAALFKYVFGR